MDEKIVETLYPITFRQVESKVLGEHLKNRHSVVLVGMKRVGISQFLRFFLNHKDIVSTYIDNGQKHLFISVDLNDLVEREVFAFWMLTLKRIVDSSERSDLSKETKKEIEDLFADSIQSKDLFFTLESIRNSLKKIIDNEITPTIFFNRFDRIKEAVNPEFFDNLHGLQDATHKKLCFVFTSFRTLDTLSPSVFPKSSLSAFAQILYIKPARKEDVSVVFDHYKSLYQLRLQPLLEEAFLNDVDGHLQYLQFGLIVLREKKDAIISQEELFEILLRDERISLQSEELWESLNKQEQNVIAKIGKKENVSEGEKNANSYLWETGIVQEISPAQYRLFNSLFASHAASKFGEKQADGNVEFTKKEHMLFDYLQKHENEICERETIIEAVWPEVTTLGVSDWAVDRLVARVRGKLKAKNSPFEIQTIKTRGYKLIPLA